MRKERKCKLICVVDSIESNPKIQVTKTCTYNTLEKVSVLILSTNKTIKYIQIYYNYIITS